MDLTVLQKKRSNSIVEGRVYFCVLGKDITVYEKSTDRSVACLNGIRYLSSVRFLSDEVLIIKTTEGIYYRWDIRESKATQIFKDKRIDPYGQDVCFSCDTDNAILYDVVQDRGLRNHILRLDIYTETADFCPVPYEGYVYPWTDFKKNFSFLQNRFPGKFGPSLVQRNKGQYVTEPIACKAKDKIYFYCAEYVLFQGGDILELSTQERHCLGIPEQYTADMKQGAFFPDRHQLLLICSNSVVVFDLLKNVVVLSWETPCVFDAKIMGNGLYVCALGGVSRLGIP